MDLGYAMGHAPEAERTDLAYAEYGRWERTEIPWRARVLHRGDPLLTIAFARGLSSERTSGRYGPANLSEAPGPPGPSDARHAHPQPQRTTRVQITPVTAHGAATPGPALARASVRPGTRPTAGAALIRTPVA